MRWAEMTDAVAEAKTTIAIAGSIAADMGRILCGKLRTCDAGDLCDLKRELRGFNMTTGKWKKLGD